MITTINEWKKINEKNSTIEVNFYHDSYQYREPMSFTDKTLEDVKNIVKNILMKEYKATNMTGTFWASFNIDGKELFEERIKIKNGIIEENSKNNRIFDEKESEDKEERSLEDELFIGNFNIFENNKKEVKRSKK
jgi:hypothetical protein